MVARAPAGSQLKADLQSLASSMGAAPTPPAEQTATAAGIALRKAKEKLVAAADKKARHEVGLADAEVEVKAAAIEVSRCKMEYLKESASLAGSDPFTRDEAMTLDVSKVLKGQSQLDICLGEAFDLTGLDPNDEDTKKLEAYRLQFKTELESSLHGKFDELKKFIEGKQTEKECKELFDRIKGKRVRREDPDEGGASSAGAGGAAAASNDAAAGAAAAAAAATPVVSPRSACQRRATPKAEGKGPTPSGTEEELAAIADSAVKDAKAKLAAAAQKSAGMKGQGSPPCL